jgi:hypothetical protein
LVLKGLRLLVAERVIHGDRHLRRHQVREGDLRQAVSPPLWPGDRQGAQASVCRGQGEGAEGSHAVLAQKRHGLGKAGFLLNVVDDQRPLLLPDPP